jgi:hypothetical protein
VLIRSFHIANGRIIGYICLHMEKFQFGIFIILICTVLSSCSGDDKISPDQGVKMHIIGSTASSFRHYIDGSLAWSSLSITPNIAGIISHPDETWSYVGNDFNNEQVYEFHNNSRLNIDELNRCIVTSTSRLGEGSVYWGFCPWKENGEGFVKNDNQITFINDSPRIVILGALTDSNERLHVIGFNYENFWGTPTGLPLYWIDGILQRLDLPDLNNIELSLLNINGEVNIFGSGRSIVENQISLFSVSQTNHTVLYTFEHTDNGFFQVGGPKSLGNDLYWTGRYKAYNGTEPDSFGYYIKNEEMIKVEDPYVVFNIVDILISGGEEHLVGSITSKFTGAPSSIYLLNRQWIMLSGIDNLVLLQLFQQ